jgi:uncharacterized membrane protein YdbT with pleckstrin-like domain
MASYVDTALIKDEAVLYRARLSKWSLWLPIVLGFLFLALFGLGLLFWLWAWVVYRTTELAVTNKRIIAKKGLIKRQTMEIFLDKVESVQVEQSVMGRIFNYGSLTISGTGGDKSPIENISDPMLFRTNFMGAVDARRT